MDKISLSIDGQPVQVRKGGTVLEAARGAGIYIPTLCDHKDLAPFGACRMCLVEIEKMRGVPPSCTTPATEGMVVRTQSPDLNKLRRSILELLLTEHPHPCLTCHRRVHCGPTDTCLRHVAVTERCVTCPKNTRCDLQNVARYLDIKEITLPYHYRSLPVETGDPFYDRNYNLCILCGRCVRICDEVVGARALTFTFRGSQNLVGTAFNRSLKDSGCIFCGACVDACPTGSLVERASGWMGIGDREVTTVCPYCGVGCQLILEMKGDKIVRVRGDSRGQANHGRTCVKGKFGLDFVDSPERLTTPLIKKDGQFVEATWDEALDLVAGKLKQYSGDQVAVISSAKCTNEENYLVQKFARTVVKTPHIDHCARLCHSSSVTGLSMAFGSAAMTNTIDELQGAACILAIGTNTTDTHPVIGMKVWQAVRRGARLIVANPREIKLTGYADLWLRHRPGSDVALLMGMARVIWDEGLADKAFIEGRCENLEPFLDSLKAFDLETVSGLTGVPAEDIARAARLYATTRPASILYAMGITQHAHGTDNVLAVANLAMLTGNLGKPSSGVNPLRGQNNVQGACDMGALPDVLPGYQRLDNAQAVAKFQEAWKTQIPTQTGLALTQIMDGAHDGRIKAIYQVGENPVVTDPDSNHVEEALKRLEFLVVQDMFLTETARLAHVVLPVASSIEREGTFTNTERRVQLLHQARKPLGESRPDWLIVCQLAQRMGAPGFDFQSPAQVMEEIARLTPSYGGISFPRLENGGLQWPCPSPEHAGTPVLHTERFTRGKGHFTPLEYRPPQEQPDGVYPLALTTARDYYHYHSGTMTRKVAGLNVLRGEEWVELNPTDATALGIASGDRVEVVSRRGRVRAAARVTGDTPAGVVTMTFHFAESRTNMLTNPALDPLARMPELKVCAVRVEKVPSPSKPSPEGAAV